jgi:hypothetical protein
MPKYQVTRNVTQFFIVDAVDEEQALIDAKGTRDDNWAQATDPKYEWPEKA